MAYLGPAPQFGNIAYQDLSAIFDSSTTTFTLSYSVAAASNILFVYGGVIQEPGVGYTVVGTTLTTTFTPTTGTTGYVCFLGISLNLPTPADDSVTAAKLAADAVIVTGTEQATTSGTAFDFTGIPAGTKRITIILDSVSLSGTDNLLIQLGDSGGIETTSYSSRSTNTADGTVSSTSGFIVRGTAGTNTNTGILHIVRMSSNKWVLSGVTEDSNRGLVSSGVKTLSGELTQLRLTRTGTDTFDSGSVNIMYEGK